MKKDLKHYINEIDDLLKNDKIKDIEEIIKEHLIKIKFFQHERLIHLIVTVFVGTISILFFLTGIIIEKISLLLLFLLTILLFIPYIFHYYYLENNTQKLYRQYYLLKSKKNTRN